MASGSLPIQLAYFSQHDIFYSNNHGLTCPVIRGEWVSWGSWWRVCITGGQWHLIWGGHAHSNGWNGINGIKYLVSMCLITFHLLHSSHYYESDLPNYGATGRLWHTHKHTGEGSRVSYCEAMSTSTGANRGMFGRLFIVMLSFNLPKVFVGRFWPGYSRFPVLILTLVHGWVSGDPGYRCVCGDPGYRCVWGVCVWLAYCTSSILTKVGTRGRPIMIFQRRYRLFEDQKKAIRINRSI